MRKEMKEKLMPVFVTLILLVSMIAIIPSSTMAAPVGAFVNISKQYPVVPGETIWVNVTDGNLIEGDKYQVKVWNDTGLVDVGTAKKADKNGDVSIEIKVPGWKNLDPDNPICPLGWWNLSLWNDTDAEFGGLGNQSIKIDSMFDVRYQVEGSSVDHATFNQTYEDTTAFHIYVYNWTGSKYEQYKESINISVLDPGENPIPELATHTTSAGVWDIDYTFDYIDPANSNVETYYYIVVNSSGGMTSMEYLPVKVDMTASLPTGVTWGDEISISGYVKDGQGDGIPAYVAALYYPVDGGYVEAAAATTYSSGRYSISALTVEGSAGTWYLGTYLDNSVGVARVGQLLNSSDYHNIPYFIDYYSFEVASDASAKVKVVSPDEIVKGFTQTINISVYDTWDKEYYHEMWVHVTGIGANYSGVEYGDDETIVISTAIFTGYSSNLKYAYYEFDIKFTETGSGTIFVTYPDSDTLYNDNNNTHDDYAANITGSVLFNIESPGDMTIIIDSMVDAVNVEDNPTPGCCWYNESSNIVISVYGDDQDTSMNGSVKITGCGIDIDEDEDDAFTKYGTAPGKYTVPISPKTAGTVTITITNSTENKSVSKDFSISGLSGSVTTSVGDDKEISVETTETITVTVVNGQYAEVHLCYFDKDWANKECLNDTTGDGTAGNGLNGVFEFTPDVADLDHVGFIVATAQAGGYFMYDIVEVAPIHDLVIDMISPDNASDRILTCGLEHSWELQVLDGSGAVVDDVDSVTGEIIDEDGDTVQTVDFSQSGDTWYLDEWVPHFACYFLITAINNTGENEHGGNASFDIGLAEITYSPDAITCGIGLENVTVEVVGVDVLGNPLPDGTKLYINIKESDSIRPISLFGDDITLDEDGKGEFEITTVGDNATKINCTLQEEYTAYKGNVTEGEFLIMFPEFILDPDTIFLGQANMITITAKDSNGQPIQGINLTFVSSLPGLLAAQPDPVETNAEGKATMSLSPLASGKLNVTIARNIEYVGGQLNWTNAVITSTYVTATSLKVLKISVSKSPIYEDETLTVTVTSGGSPVSVADVEFGGTTAQTDSSGKATFTVPDPGVESAVYTITAEKAGYVPEEKSITVIKIYGITLIGPGTPPGTGETFTITAIAKGSALAGATVSFDGKTYTTGADGSVELTAPSEEGTYTVTGTYEGYEDVTITVTIDAGSIPGFELLTLIAAIGVAFIILRRRRN